MTRSCTRVFAALVALLATAAQAGPIVVDRSTFTPAGETDTLAIGQIAAFFDVPNAQVQNFEGLDGSAPDNTAAVTNYAAPNTLGNSIPGLEFGSGDRLMGGQPGFGYLTPFTVVGNQFGTTQTGDGGDIEFSFVETDTGARIGHEVVGFIVADGPANDQVYSFFDAGDVLLGSFAWSDLSNETGGFAGWSDTVGSGVSRVLIESTGTDDHYIDDLTFGRAAVASVPQPGVLGLLMLGMLGVALRAGSVRREQIRPSTPGNAGPTALPRVGNGEGSSP